MIIDKCRKATLYIYIYIIYIIIDGWNGFFNNNYKDHDKIFVEA